MKTDKDNNKIDDMNKYDYKCSRCDTFSINWDTNWINYNELCAYYVCVNCGEDCYDKDNELINETVIYL